MTKLINFIIIVLIIIFGSVAALAYFDLWPFSQKTIINLKEKNQGESSCVILDEIYCDKGEFVYNEKAYLVGIGFKLPKGTKIYAPFKGKMESPDTKVEIEGNIYRSSILLDITSDNYVQQPTKTIFTALGYHQQETKNTFAKDDVFALVSDSPVDSKLGDYNLILNFRVFYNRTNQWYTNINLLRQFFKEVKD